MDLIITQILPLVLGYLLDLLLGDPRTLPHPIRVFGSWIYYLEPKINQGKYLFFKGALFAIVSCVGVWFVFYFFSWASKSIHSVIWVTFNTIFVFYGLANTSLLEEGKAVFDTLKNKGLVAGRKRLSWIVGRDTQNLSENQIKIAVFETLSENLSDGVIAPLFYFALGGIPAMMTYKMINTLDSMIGYKNAKYFYFGKFAAKLDDIANYIPARLTALLMIMVTGSWQLVGFVRQFGPKHASPNSGYPEAALAGILNCQFGGPNIYQSVLVNKPHIGTNARIITNLEFTKVFWINQKTTFAMVVLLVIVKFFCLL